VQLDLGITTEEDFVKFLTIFILVF